MGERVKCFWLRIHYSGKVDPDIEIHTGTSLQGVLDVIERAQAGRLKRYPRSPRVVRIAALREPPLDPEFRAFLDEMLRLENNSDRARFDPSSRLASVP